MPYQIMKIKFWNSGCPFNKLLKLSISFNNFLFNHKGHEAHVEIIKYNFVCLVVKLLLP